MVPSPASPPLPASTTSSPSITTNQSMPSSSSCFSSLNKKSLVPAPHLTHFANTPLSLPPSPPSSLALPLLSGLQSRALSSHFLNQALDHFAAVQTLSRFFGSPSSQTERMKKYDKRLPLGNSTIMSHHWLFRCLVSDSLRLRRSACLLLLQGLSDNGDEREMILLRNVLHSLITHVLERGSGSGSGGGGPGGSAVADPTIQLFGILTHVIISDGGGATTTTTAPLVGGSGGFGGRKRKLLSGAVSSVSAAPTDSKNNNANSTSSSRSLFLPSFVAAGGLRWMGHTLLTLLYPPDNNACRQTQIMLFIDLLIRLITSHPKVHLCFWTSQLPAVTLGDVDLTPLACFFLAHEVLKNTPAKLRGLERSLYHLGKLLDPKDGASSNNNANDDKDGEEGSGGGPHNLSSSLQRKRRKINVISMARLAAGGSPAHHHPSFLYGNHSSSNPMIDHHTVVEDDEDNDDDKDDDDSDDDEDSDDEDNVEDDENDGSDDDDECCSDEDNDEGCVVCDDEDMVGVVSGGIVSASSSSPAHHIHGNAPLIPQSSVKATDRRRLFLRAGMRILSSQNNHNLLLPGSRHSLLQSLCHMVLPPPQRLHLKIFLRRAPSQEEFFRGSLTKNPITLSSLNSPDPLVSDLRQHIASDLQMSDSAELLELLVAGKIIGMNLKVRVVQQTLWKRHVMDHSSSGAGGGVDNGYGSDAVDPAHLPPMVVTYRLAGVDGEATEDTVEDLDDPQEQKNKNEGTSSKYEITKVVAEHKGIIVLLKTLERDIREVLRRVRRDNIGNNNKKSKRNKELEAFMAMDAGPGLVLLRYCAEVKVNRVQMVKARAPSLLLRLLLDVLGTIDRHTHISKEGNQAAPVTNPTADLLQELIEILASDISCSSSASHDKEHEELEEEDATLPFLLSSLHKTSLSPHLLKAIANLLPFLTYGIDELSQSLANEFLTHVNSSSLQNIINERNILRDTFIEAAINLPPVKVCHSFRVALLQQGFVNTVMAFLMRDGPAHPPLSLYKLLHGSGSETTKPPDLEKEWTDYVSRPGLGTVLKILIGLGNGHTATQNDIAQYNERGMSLLRLLHWIENTTDASLLGSSNGDDGNNGGVDTNEGLGLLAETLLDTLKEGNDSVTKMIKSLRQETRDKKKQIAEERRQAALKDMGVSTKDSNVKRLPLSTMMKNNFFSKSNNSKQPASTATPTPSGLPAWMAEMEAMEDEEGLTCIVCQEGRTLQPTELLGLYTYVKKVVIPSSQCGSRSAIDGSQLLSALPVVYTGGGGELFEGFWRQGKSVASVLQMGGGSSRGSGSERPGSFVTSVTAGNAIHCSCHGRARQADRNHPKAPKSEWEGASLRNSRVTTNLILPLISPSHTPTIPLIAVESALADHQTIIANTLSSRPKCMLWTTLHDIRLLLLRIAYGEPLNSDSGGGSLTSNVMLCFYQLFLADLLGKDAEHDSPVSARQARFLPGGFIVAMELVTRRDQDGGCGGSVTLARGVADASIMAGLCSILFPPSSSDSSGSHRNSLWLTHRLCFLRGFIRCAGRRFSCGVNDSGCISARAAASVKRSRSNISSFTDWDSNAVVESSSSGKDADGNTITNPATVSGSGGDKSSLWEDAATALRPLLTLFGILDQMAHGFTPTMDDVSVAESTERIVHIVERCGKARGLCELMEVVLKTGCSSSEGSTGGGGIVLGRDEILEEFDRGRKSV